MALCATFLNLRSACSEVVSYLNVGSIVLFLNILLRFIHLFCLHLCTYSSVCVCTCHDICADQRITCMSWVGLYYCHESLGGQIQVIWIGCQCLFSYHQPLCPFFILVQARKNCCLWPTLFYHFITTSANNRRNVMQFSGAFVSRSGSS